jgi:glucose-1-phosphatase
MIISSLRDHKILVFDLGNVIIDLNWERWRSEFSGLGLNSKDITVLTESSLFLDYEIGCISEEELLEGVNSTLELSLSMPDFVARWNMLLGEIPKKKLDLLKLLQSNYRVLVLSNTNALHVTEFNRRILEVTGFILDEWVDRTYYSNELGLRKPDSNIFEKVVEQENCLPQDMVFFDDNTANIQAASQLGMTAVHISHPDKLWEYFE